MHKQLTVGGLVLVLQNHQHTLKMGTMLVPETSGKLHILTLLSARECFIEFCRRECCNTYILDLYV